MLRSSIGGKGVNPVWKVEKIELGSGCLYRVVDKNRKGEIQDTYKLSDWQGYRTAVFGNESAASEFAKELNRSHHGNT